MAKGIEYFISRRTSKSERGGGGGVMMPIATLAVALSIGVMVITLAVISGFKQEIQNRLTALSGQMLVTSVGGGSATNLRTIYRDELLVELTNEGAERQGVEVEKIAPYATRGAILRTATAVEGVLLKGIDGGYDMSIFEEGLVEGDLPSFGGEVKSRNAIISKRLADEQQLKIGDRLELLTTDSEVSNSGGVTDKRMRRDLYKVGAIYTAGLGDMEKYLIMVDIRNVQRLNGWQSSQITGYEVWLSDVECAMAVANELNRLLVMTPSDAANGVAAYSTQELFPALFDWLKSHDINGVVILSIMLVVAIFNIITALLILVLERTQTIGVLKVLGMKNSSIRRVFLYRAFSIATKGMLWGNGVAIALCVAQRHFGFLKLDESGYMLSQVPVELSVEWLIYLNLGVVAAILLLVVLPTRIVSSIEPSKTIKFE